MNGYAEVRLIGFWPPKLKKKERNEQKVGLLKKLFHSIFSYGEEHPWNVAKQVKQVARVGGQVQWLWWEEVVNSNPSARW